MNSYYQRCDTHNCIGAVGLTVLYVKLNVGSQQLVDRNERTEDVFSRHRYCKQKTSLQTHLIG